MPNSNAVQAASPRLTLIATSLGFVLIILDVTVVNVALERIEASLGTNVTGRQWVVNAYTLVFASLLLTAGALSDRFGARRMFVNGFALFTAASLACGLAGSITVLIAARIAQGVGAALCVPASLALVSASFPDAVARARAVSIWAGVGGFALAAGPVVGGVMVDRFGWPSIFFLNLPLGVVGLWLTLAYAPLGSRTASRGLDVAGQVLAVIALGALTFGFVESGEFGWTHPLILAGFGVFGIASTLFVLTEARSPDPMLQLSLFREPAVGAACLVGLLTNFAYYGLMFVLSLFFQAAKGYSPLVTGLAFLPMTALVTIASLIAGALTARFGPRLPMVLGQALAAFGYFALAGTGAGTSYAVIAGPLLAAGVGVALTVPSMTAAVLANVDKRRTGVASGALNAARQTGGVVGVGVFGSLVAGPDRLLGGLHLALILAGAALVIGCLVSILGTGPRRSAKDTVSTVAAPEPSL
jgi:DHA2 family methylenomycin A resistance protein-like MFS transporter